MKKLVTVSALLPQSTYSRLCLAQPNFAPIPALQQYTCIWDTSFVPRHFKYRAHSDTIKPLTALNHHQNTASRVNEISSGFSEENIIEERIRRRRQAYLTALEQPGKPPGYLSAFTSEAQLRLHRDQLLKDLCFNCMH
jgi:hypothetical protein